MSSANRVSVISGVGGWVPPHIVTNHDLSSRLNISDQWIRSRTGISERRVISKDMATSDLAFEAAARALKMSTDSSSIDAVVLATTTPDWQCPATAPDIAFRLGLSRVAAFDVSAVCSGFLYALAVAQGLIAAETADRVLVIGADAFTTIVNPSDRDTAIIFGDGAGAAILRAGSSDELGALGPVVLGSDGELHDLAIVPAGGSRQRSTGLSAEPDDLFLHMNGRQTFRHAIERMSSASRQAVSAAGWNMHDVDRLVAHQANVRIMDMVAAELEIPGNRLLSNIDHVGNTCAASIPLLLAEATEDGRLTAGQRILMTAFGGGLTWGATTLTWPFFPNP
jgi:3-oxoacyl-[acyl-carrier-protein] synthase-3